MISFEPLWTKLDREEKKPTVLLEGEHAISRSTLLRIKTGKEISMETIDKICATLMCPVYEVVEHVKD